MVSRTHAEIVRTGEDHILRDLGSVNGTYLNGSLITKATLRHGDQITMGDTALRVELTSTGFDRRSTDSHVVLCSTTPNEGERLRLAGQPTALQASLMSEDAGRAQRAHQRLETLVSVTQTLTRLRELDELFPLVVDEVMNVLPAERGVLLRVTADGSLQPRCARNVVEPGGQVEVSRTIVDEVVSHRQCVLSADALLDDNIDMSESIMFHNIRSVLCVPIEYDKELLGVVYLDTPGRESLFTEDDLHFVSGIAGAAAVAITNATAVENVRSAHQELNHAYLSMLSVLANAIEARDHYTIGHTWRVARFAQVVARQMGWDEEKISEIEVGGMLHDIGKIGVPDSILTKAGSLSAEEQEMMQLHPQIGARMLRDVPSLEHVLPYVLYHHERFDGAGYPGQLEGQAIPIEARLLAVADALDAMTSNRPYRRSMDLDAVLDELRQEAGQQFDPAIVEALLCAYDEGELEPYLQVGLHDALDVICPYCSTYHTPEAEAIERGHGRCPTCKHSLILHRGEGSIFAELA
jgi:putative nucleotidyltransferase with HDIG domain